MGFLDGLRESQVQAAIDTLNSTSSKLMLKGAVNTLAKNADTNPFVIPSLRNVAAVHPNDEIRTLAETQLRRISQVHHDPVIRNRAKKALDSLDDK
ncbi:MAG: hypothetical protein MI685_11590 [Chlorobiales bacterium]|nr:hypothetical protein [Chlorobiales bacterium]